MTKIKDITNYLETIAPLPYQESYDNSGLIIGNAENTVTGVLASLDCTEAVVEEAIKRKCNLIVAHHPILFKPLKKLTGSNYVERTLLKAIKNEVAIYAIHTNLDNIKNGVNKKIAEKLGLMDCEILMPKTQTLNKLVTFVPTTNTDEVLEALGAAGAGQIGNYQDCSFIVPGTGSFRPNEQAKPSIGKANQLEQVSENRLEVILPAAQVPAVIDALKNAHPYEEVAYYLQPLLNHDQNVGSGLVGNLSQDYDSPDFLQFLKDAMSLNCIRHTPYIPSKIRKIAICGGAGSFLLPQAKARDCQVLVTADFKYHEFFEADGQLIVADIGHYESEAFTKELIFELLNEKFSNFALHLSKVETNPVQYF